LEHVS